MKKSSVTMNVIYNMLFQIFTTCLPVITTPYLSRTLGLYQSGVYSFVDSIVTLFTIFGTIGTSLYGCRKIAYVRDDKEKLSITTYEIILLKLLLLIPVFVIYLFLFCLFNEYSIYFIINILTVIGSAIEISWFYNGIEDFKSITIRNFIIKIIFIICLFIFIKSPRDLGKYVFLVCTTNFLGNVSMWFILKKYLLPLKKVKLHPFKHLKESFTLFIPQSANYVYSLADKTMLGYLTPTLANVGVYDYAYRIVKMIISILQSMGYVILSRIANLSANNNKKDIKKYINKSISFSLFLAFPMMLGIVAIAKNFVPIYLGTEFQEVSQVILVICPLIVLTSFNSILGTQLLLAIKKDKEYTRATVIGAITNIILNFILIPYIGIYGACLTSLFSELLVFIMELHYSKEYVKLKEIIINNYKPLIASLIMFIICKLIGLINLNIIIVLLLQIGLSIFIYFGLMFIMKDKIFIEIVNKILTFLKIKYQIKES